MGAFPDLDLSLSPSPPRIIFKDVRAEREVKDKLGDTGSVLCQKINGIRPKSSPLASNISVDKQKKDSQKVIARFNDRL